MPNRAVLPAIAAVAVAVASLAACSKTHESPRAAASATPPSSVGASAAPAVSSRYLAREVTGGKSLSVRVQFTGKRRATSWTVEDHYKEHCGTTSAPDESLAVGADGGLDGVVVWLDDIAAGAALKPTKVVQDQKGCVFAPHVLAVGVGSTLELTNSDPAVHQVRLDFGGGDVLTRTIAPGGANEVVARPEWAGRMAAMTCPIHLWMWGSLHVFDHPYFAVTKGGAAKLDGVPPGAYHLSLWHEGLGPTYKNELALPPSDTTRVAVVVDHEDVRLSFEVDDSGKITPSR